MLIILELFVMLVLANGTPVVAAGLLKNRWSAPVDGGRLLSDGRPVFGESKTWRVLYPVHWPAGFSPSLPGWDSCSGFCSACWGWEEIF